MIEVLENDKIEKVSQALFSDLYLGPDHHWFKGIPGKRNPEPAPLTLKNELEEMYKIFQKAHSDVRGKDIGLAHDGVYYRSSIMPSIKGDVFVLRKLPSAVPDLQELKINTHIITQLLSPNASGLILVCGAPSNGKTTSASAIVKSRLTNLGGVAITGEDPPEMPLHGEHGKGICFQTITNDDTGGYSELAKLIVRWNPDIILYGEIRDKDVAEEAIKASIAGRLVISTVHSDNVVGAINRVFSLAKEMESGNAALLLAHGLYGVIHQKLTTNNEGKTLSISEFIFINDSNRISVRKCIEEQRFTALGSEIQLQKNQMLMGPA